MFTDGLLLFGPSKPIHDYISCESIKPALLCSSTDRDAPVQNKMNGMSVSSILGSPFSDPDEDWENSPNTHDKARYDLKWSAKSHIDLKLLPEHKICHKRPVSEEFIKVKDGSTLSGHYRALYWRLGLHLRHMFPFVP